MTTALIASDLDRTLIYSRAAMTRAQFDRDDLLCVEYHKGAPLSYLTETSAQRLRELSTTAQLVPTTTRTPAQFRRIALPGGPWRYAITSNGGAILVDGEPDPAWREGLDRAVWAGGAGLDEVLTALRARISPDWVRKLRIADDLFCYLVVDVDAQPADFLVEWDEWCRARGWGASQQGRKIYTVPDSVCKSHAVAEVHRRLVADGVLSEDSPVFAAGDGALDAPMLEAADAAIRPCHGELEALNWQHPTVAVTEESGVSAGEEILAWFAGSTRIPSGS
ncbi:HAD family hydrolase [Rhodococcus sp. CX]|nr:HAD family hydrolase [Rhodococcus sp. CX]